MGTKTISIKQTHNYSIFKRLMGNRDVTNKRVAIIKDSIQNVGYISNPIICNEKLEIIDGQGRLEALRQLDMPVEYRIIPNIGIDECRAMNLKPTSWTLEDFIKSYAEYGNDNYLRLVKLNDEYKYGFGVTYSIIKDHLRSGGESSNDIKAGTFEFPEECYERVENTLQYLQRFDDIQKRVGGRKDLFYQLIGWSSNLDGVDKDRLCRTIHQQVSKLSPCAKTEITLHEMSEIYNWHYPDKRFFENDFVMRDKSRKAKHGADKD